jgi:hypothetical protein
MINSLKENGRQMPARLFQTSYGHGTSHDCFICRESTSTSGSWKQSRVMRLARQAAQDQIMGRGRCQPSTITFLDVRLIAILMALIDSAAGEVGFPGSAQHSKVRPLRPHLPVLWTISIGFGSKNISILLVNLRTSSYDQK